MRQRQLQHTEHKAEAQLQRIESTRQKQLQCCEHVGRRLQFCEHLGEICSILWGGLQMTEKHNRSHAFWYIQHIQWQAAVLLVVHEGRAAAAYCSSRRRLQHT
jgi:hypothetical protein